MPVIKTQAIGEISRNCLRQMVLDSIHQLQDCERHLSELAENETLPAHLRGSIVILSTEIGRFDKMYDEYATNRVVPATVELSPFLAGHEDGNERSKRRKVAVDLNKCLRVVGNVRDPPVQADALPNADSENEIGQDSQL